MPNNSRYERKYFIDSLFYHEVINIIKINPAMFRYVYKQRFINNVYYDTPNYTNYIDYVDGIVIRSKYRIRWYGDLLSSIVNPVFEIKNKFGNIGDKEGYALQDFQLEENMASDQLQNIIKNSKLPEKIKYLP